MTLEVPLSSNEKTSLLTIARQAVSACVTGLPPDHSWPDSGRLGQPGAAFVTLKLAGQLRGCIGKLRADSGSKLDQVVHDMAQAAALRDPRFSPIVPAELPELEFEISVMGPMVVIEATEIDRIRIGIHGIYITAIGRTGVLLPQVASENEWDVKTFLEQTCRKARIEPDGWRHRGCQIEIFTAQVFKDAGQDND